VLCTLCFVFLMNLKAKFNGAPVNAHQIQSTNYKEPLFLLTTDA